MRPRTLTLGLLGSLAALSLAPRDTVQGQERPKPAAFRWESDLETARARARTEGRPLLVVFR